MFGYQACHVCAQLEHVFSVKCPRLDENDGNSYSKLKDIVCFNDFYNFVLFDLINFLDRSVQGRETLTGYTAL